MNNDALKLCIDCKQEIHADANKCVHCGSYQQGWQKHFSFTTTTLSLLIALISVLGALLPNLLTAIFYSEPRLSVSVRNVNNSGLEMDVVNIGKAAAVLANEIECTRMIYKDESVFADVASQSFDKIINGIANPKSMITGRRFSSIMMLSGFKSRCSTPRSCAS